VQDGGGLGCERKEESGDRKEPHPAILLYSVTLVTEFDTL
jgi:hypothetical protein